MSREYFVFGEFIVKVSGGRIGGDIEELGLTSDPVRIVPRYNHKDVNTDDFGDAPVETIWRMMDASLSMTLVHYDTQILDKCMSSTMGGGLFDSNPNDNDDLDGTMASNGRILGFNRGLGTAANMYTTVYLIPTNGAIVNIDPYRFKACYLDGRPLEIPLGTERSLVKLHWRVIPYQQITTNNFGAMEETTSSGGVVLWDRSDELLL